MTIAACNLMYKLILLSRKESLQFPRGIMFDSMIYYLVIFMARFRLPAQTSLI